MRPSGSTKLHSNPVFKSLILPHFLALGALVWVLGGCGVNKLVCPSVSPSQSISRKHSLLMVKHPFSTHAECSMYPFPLVSLCRSSLRCVDVVYLSNQANKFWQKEHRFYRNNSNHAKVVIIMITVITACSFFLPQSAKQFS